ncbi:MAG: PIN domain-containing protein [Thermoflexibacter sp.]|jgi:predicted nucleic acid-binding protein|nr:PIN domain-containing protein [Thermoflexibacter sp.]
MKRYILDANIIFTALISGKPLYLNFVANNQCFTTDFAFVEIEKYKEIIMKKSKIKLTDLQKFTKLLFEYITVIPSLYITEENQLQAIAIGKNIDEKDTPYIALALEMEIPLITQDKKLYNGLQKINFEYVILWEDLLNNLQTP